MNNTDCLFCKILCGEIPCCKVYEDDQTLAFLDIGPITPGHTLVIPRTHVETITEADPEIVAALFKTARLVAAAQLNALGSEGVNILQNNGAAAGQVVNHMHVHVIPRSSKDGHHWNWNPKSYENMDEMKSIAETIAGGF